MTFQSRGSRKPASPTKDKIGEKYMKNTKEQLIKLKHLMTIVNDENIKQTLKDSAFLELWQNLETPVAKCVQKTVAKCYLQNRPSSDLVQDAIFESVVWVISNSKAWDPSKNAGPATWAFKKIAQLTMKVCGGEKLTLDIDETTEEGALKKQDLEMRLLEESAWGRAFGLPCEEAAVEHPFDMLANLDDQVVSLLLEALQYLLVQGLITDDGAIICTERITGTEYSIIAEYLGKSEAATRKISERVNAELKKLNLEMPRYADLIKIPMIANVVNGKASKKSK